MSIDALRKAVVDEVERLNAEAMNNACRIRPGMTTTADGLAMMVVDNLAMARAFATCASIVETEFRKLTNPEPETPAEDKPKVREIY